MNIKQAQKWFTRKKAVKSLREMADEAGLEYFWLIKFASGKINSPGYELMNKVITYIESQYNQRG